MIYLDYNATTPVDPAVVDAMLPYLTEHFGNPSSGHAFGRRAREAVEAARADVADLLGAAPEEIVFTSGGSEANTMAVLGVAHTGPGRHVVTSAVEHPAILEPCRVLEEEGYEVTRIGVDDRGRVDPDAVAAALCDDTVLVTVMLANNEVGTLQPVREIAAAVHARAHAADGPGGHAAGNARVHTDAAQAVGKIPVNVDDLGVDLLTVAGHKLYAPKGVGALYLRRGIDLPSLIHGASHEDGRRAGTENVAGIVGLGAACSLAAAHLDEEAARLRGLRERLWAALKDALPDTIRHGDPDHGLPNTLSVAFPGVVAPDLLAAVGDGIAASAGAACHAEGVTVSSVLEAMRVPREAALGTVRLSLGRPTAEAEVDRAATLLTQAARAVRTA